MAIRYFSGVAACLGVVGALSAQQPAASLSKPSPMFGPAGRFDTQTHPVVGSASRSYPVSAQTPAQYAPAHPSAYRANPASQPNAGYQSGARTVQAPQEAGQPMPGAPAPRPAAPAANGTVPAQAPAATSGVAPIPGGVAGLPYAAGGCPVGGCGGEVCGAAGCASCATCDCLCGPPGRVWVSAEWLYWTASGNPVPALLTAAPPGTARATAGALGAPTTTVLYGGRRINDDFRNGFRLNAGVWLDECQRVGIDGDFFFLSDSRQGFAAAGTGAPGTPIITRPFFNALTGAPDTQLVSFPGVLAGATAVDSTSSVIGGGASFLNNLCCDPCGRVDLVLGGYRYINLRDELTVTEDLTALPGSAVPAGTRFRITDRFVTDNDFHGVPIGVNFERRWDSWYVGVRATVALGVSHQTTTISGSTQITGPGGAAQTFPGGLLTQGSNIGRYTNDEFAVVPEVGVRVGAQVTDNLRAFVGYNFLYWSDVARSGDQIDLRVNPNQIAPPQPLNGPAVPAFTGKTTDYWLQGVSVGAEYRF